MKLKISNILMLCIIVGLAYVSFLLHTNRTESGRLAAINNKIDSLETCIVQKQKAIDSINVQTAMLCDSIARIGQNIQTYKQQLQQIKNKYAKVKTTSNATPVEIASFFSDRYGK